MTRELNRALVALVHSISENGVTHIVSESYPYQTVCRIIETGKDLQFDGPEFDEDTEQTARALANPVNWGITDPAWKDFLEKWSHR